jgi:hypothetical protein
MRLGCTVERRLADNDSVRGAAAAASICAIFHKFATGRGGASGALSPPRTSRLKKDRAT